MLKGFAITPPVIGRIAIGKMIEKNGMRLPEKDDEFTLTSQVQNREGWVKHPLDTELRKVANEKLRSIPVRLLFDDPDLSLRAKYTMFERSTGRQICVGDGETCRRMTANGMQTLPCPAPDACPLAVGGNCKPYGRLNVCIDSGGPTGRDELGSFILRTTGFNSIRTLAARLRYFHAASGGLLSLLPLALRLRGKSTSLSHRTPIFYVDLTLRSDDTLAEVIGAARTEQQRRLEMGFNQAALDESARSGFALGDFEESEEEGAGVVEEFYPGEEGGDGIPDQGELADQKRAADAGNLAAKLRRKTEL